MILMQYFFGIIDFYKRMDLKKLIMVVATGWLCISLCYANVVLAANKPDYLPPPVAKPTPTPEPATITPPQQATPNPTPELPSVDVSNYLQQGVAAWYPAAAHGKRTASGEIYDIYAFTAAHTQLPLGAKVRVTHLNTQRSVVVVINDRLQPTASRGSIIQLSFYAAKLLGLLTHPEQRVEIRGLPTL